MTPARVLLSAALLLLLVACVPESPRARGGELDLRGWDFSSQGSASLDGQWQMLWQPVGPAATVARAGWAELPGFWNAAADSPYPPEGAATYRLKVKLPVGNWSVSLPDISCAWRLTVNTVVLAENGIASPVASIYRAHVQPRVVPLPPGLGEADLSLYVVNRSDRVGGVRDSITLGTSVALGRQENLARLDSGFTTGGLLVMALFNLVIFFLQRQKTANLWLALFSVFIAVRTVFTGPRVVYDLWPWLTFELSAQIVFLGILGAVSSFIFYFKHLFPAYWPSRVFVPFLLYTGLFVVLVPLLPVRTYSEAFTVFYDAPLVVMTFFFLGMAWWAMRKKHEDGLLVFVGMLFLLAGTLNDIAYQFVPLPHGDVLGKFLFLFLVFNTFLLSRQLSKDYALTQRQSGELRKLDQMKDDFLARVTHELRTPLHGMIGILDGFRMGDFGPMSDRQTYHIGLLESSSKRLLSMVSSILDFSHLKKNRLVAESRPILLKQTVDFLLPSFSPHLKPSVTLSNRLSEQLPAALGDEVRLEQILHNLIRNGLQHTEAGSVVVEAEVKDQQILLSVRDTGSGIPQEKLEQLFTPFHQVNEIDTRANGGLGLGLAVSRQLAEKMGGRLDLQSVEGVGTVVTITLPVCPPARLQYFQTRRIDRTLRREEPTSPEAPSSNSTEAPAGPVVLIVDDEPVNLLVLRTFLNRIGYTILEATNGQEALQLAESHVIDLAILDIMMPGMSGYQVCAALRERFTPARLPVLLLTAKNQVEDLLQGYRCGASDFLTKPFQRDELKARMELHLKVSRAARSGLVIPNKTSS